ncbi:hypothetical protein [Luteolibacter soli]|uniref:Uncharacterized protein n=1 Tax=Luteolibacter soli TaxID=3135280 RepID=A0ABU9AW21_9BACT
MLSRSDGGKTEKWKSKAQITLEAFVDRKLVDESGEAWAGALEDLK